MPDIFKVGIVGISGYTGLELVKILLNHKHFKINYLANSSGDSTLHSLYPNLINTLPNLAIERIDLERIKGLDLVFLALPHKESMSVVPKILDSCVKVIDLSADYRLNLANYEANYCKHLDSANLQNAVYGLIEWNRNAIKKASLIANPGCYPTASLLGILPFVEHLGDCSIFIDAKSGVSGAGKKLSDNTHFPTINENIFSYSPLKHRHSIEIKEKCEFFGKKAIKVNFVPHLSPFTRGMLVSIFARLKEPLNPSEILKTRYENEPFIRIAQNPVSVKNTAGSHFCDIFAMADSRDLFISVSIDNLLRGASSQAVACANLVCGLEETHALPNVVYMP